MPTERLDSSVTLQLRCATFLVLEGPAAGRTTVLASGSLVLGSSVEVDLYLPDRGVSQRHAEVSILDGVVKLRDLGSTNGTYLNGNRIVEAFLSPGDLLGFGESRVKFQPRVEQIQILPSGRDHFGPLFGDSLPMRQLFGVLERIAPSDTSVLISGETGTGKDLVARAIHEASSRNKGPLIILDCSSIQPELIASELFGHIEGAFTGARGRRQGVFEAGAGGTIFLDEIGELPLELQPHLLRVLEAREVRPLGGVEPIKVDVRVLAATHRDLAALMKAGKFRQDLYYRLAVVKLELPSLRTRREDVPGLARHLLDGLRRSGIAAEIAPEALAVLATQSWPGNIRELRNVLERSLALSADGSIGVKDLLLDESSAPANETDFGDRTLAEIEREVIRQALDRNGGNQKEAARRLGIHRDTLRLKMQKYGLRGGAGD